MVINPALIDTVTVPNLPTVALALTNLFAHSAPNGSLGKQTINNLCTFIAPYVASVGASSYVEVASNVLPNPVITNGFSLIGKGTYTQTGEGNLTLSGDVNIVTWNGTTWVLTKEIFFDLEGFVSDNELIIETSRNIKSSSKNLFNKDTAILDYYLVVATGEIEPQANWFTSAFIPVTPGVKYVNLTRYAFYDIDGIFISGGTNNDVDPGVTAPAGSAFMRISKAPIITYLATHQVEIGDVRTPYQPFYQVNGEVIEYKTLDFDDLYLPRSKNLYNKNTVLLDYVLYDANLGVPIYNTGYFVSDFIRVLPSTQYVSNIRAFVTYYYDKETAIGTGTLSASAPFLINVPSNCNFIRISWIKEDVNIFQVELGGTSTAFDDYYLLSPGSVKNTLPSVTYVEIIVDATGTIGVGGVNFNDIKSALDSITDASRYKRYRVSVRNGVYDISLAAYPHLGFKSWVEVVGQSKGGVIVKNVRATFDNLYSCFDIAFYSDEIEYSAIKNMTLIAYNGKAPVHIDDDYSKLAKGGIIEVEDCRLINNNTSGMGNYQNGMAVGLFSGQKVVGRRIESNGILWCHNNHPFSSFEGVSFELYDCKMPWTRIQDLYNYASDVFRMVGCKINYLVVSAYNAYSHKRSYNEYSWDMILQNNEIGYVIGEDIDDTSSRWALWDNMFNGKFAVTDTSIHSFMKNNTGSTITRGALVSLSNNFIENTIKDIVSGDILYGQALENIVTGEYGVVQYSGILFMQATGTIAIGTPLKLNGSNILIPGTSTDYIGVSLDALSGSGEIRVKLK